MELNLRERYKFKKITLTAGSARLGCSDVADSFLRSAQHRVVEPDGIEPPRPRAASLRLLSPLTAPLEFMESDLLKSYRLPEISLKRRNRARLKVGRCGL
jgi:hypothetical protein